MALITAGTPATTTLQGLKVAFGGIAGADIDLLNRSVLDDIMSPQRISHGAVSIGTGQLFVPNRGVLEMKPGDYVLFDPATGWPILLSKLAAAGASWVHT